MIFNSRVRALSAAALAAIVPAGSTAADPYARPLALAGEQAVGMPPDYIHAFLFAPIRDQNINQNNQVTTPIGVLNLGNTNQAEFVVFSGSSSASFAPVARSDTDLPGLPGVRTKIMTPVRNSTGTFAIGADLQGPGTTTADNLGFLVGTSANDLTMVARKGDPVPGAADAVHIRSMLFPAINDQGVAAIAVFMGGATNSTNNSGIYLHRPGAATLEKFVRGGDPTPDNPAQWFTGASITRITLQGQFLFIGGVGGAGISNANNVALWSGTSAASLTRVAQTGMPLANGLALGQFNATHMSLNTAGRFAGRSTLVGAGTNSGNNDVAFYGSATEPVAIFAREGDFAPVPAAPATKYSGAFTTVVSGSGMVVIGSQLTGSGIGSGIFAGTTPTNVAAVALANTPAPGAPAGAKFDFLSSNAFSDIAANANDQIGFLANLRYVGDSATHQGLYVHDPVQGLLLLARTGGTVEIAPGVIRTITSLDIGQGGNGMDAQPSSLNDNGTFVFQANYTGGAGIFTATVPLVGDVNLDGLVNFTDFLNLEARFGTTNAARLDGDLNGDTAVDHADFMLLYHHFGNTVDGALPVSPADQQSLDFFAANVPEPALTMPALAALALLRRRAPV